MVRLHALSKLRASACNGRDARQQTRKHGKAHGPCYTHGGGSPAGPEPRVKHLR